MDDDGLIVRVAAGDDTALRELFCRHAPWLAARLRSVLSAADVEDVLQETFLAGWKGAGGDRPGGAAGGGGGGARWWAGCGGARAGRRRCSSAAVALPRCCCPSWSRRTDGMSVTRRRRRRHEPRLTTAAPRRGPRAVRTARSGG